ncbi:MAG: succinyl-diaminopimelate desuccinylase [Gammaproteobacteria bacterium]|nr:succinyl-diaminopimelate desuccinylase [Gammaproteobacteria bacterium]
MNTGCSRTVSLACELIARESVTPVDAGCQEILAERLRKIGFECEALNFGEVTNLWATCGGGARTLVFAGHTDVVPTGPIDEWDTPPFTPVIRDGVLYGRGAADMKGSIAAMVTAAERFIGEHGTPDATLGFLITSDEEGAAVDGTVRVVDELRRRNQNIDWCVVGEPSSSTSLGDTVRNGRRGSLSGKLRVLGQQGHIAYPDQADNPIHRISRIVAALREEQWDGGNDYFPPTSLQVSNLHAGSGAENIIPGSAEMHFNFRFGSASTAQDLQARSEAIIASYAPRHELDWRLSGLPFITPAGKLTQTVSQAVAAYLRIQPQLSTGGGTSDGRFIAQLGTQVVELGPINATIHKINEQVDIADLELLSTVYEDIMRRLLTT